MDLKNLRHANPEPHELDNEKTDLWFLIEPSKNSDYDYEAHTSLAFTPLDFPVDCSKELSKKHPESRCQFYYKILFDVLLQNDCQQIDINNDVIVEENACIISR